MLPRSANKDRRRIGGEADAGLDLGANFEKKAALDEMARLLTLHAGAA